MEIKLNWKVITHLVCPSFSNENNVEWHLVFNRYVDESRTAVTGPILGYMDKEGNIKVINPRKHRVIYGKSTANYYPQDCGTMIWLEDQEVYQ